MQLLNIKRAIETKTVADVVLVHGLGGSACSTWGYADEEAFPRWLTEDFPEVDVWTVTYSAHWWKNDMPYGDRATTFGDALIEKGLGSRPIIFVTHSLGGIITKEMLFQAQQVAFSRFSKVLNQCKGVIFLGTPHIGSRVAQFAKKIGWGATLVSQLRYGNDNLARLKTYFVGLSNERGLENSAYAETRNYHLLFPFLIVCLESADPGMVTPVPLEKSHKQLTSPDSRSDMLYISVKNNVADLLEAPAPQWRYMSVAESERVYLANLLNDQSIWQPIPRVRLRLSHSSDLDILRFRYLVGRAILGAFDGKAAKISVAIDAGTDDAGEDYLEIYVPQLKFAAHLRSIAYAWDRAYQIAKDVPEDGLPEYAAGLLKEALQMAGTSDMMDHTAARILEGFHVYDIEALPDQDPGVIVTFPWWSEDADLMLDPGIFPLAPEPSTMDLLVYVALRERLQRSKQGALIVDANQVYDQVWEQGHHALWKVEIHRDDPNQFRIHPEFSLLDLEPEVEV